MTAADLRTQFLNEALWHGSLEKANAMLASHPEIASSDIHVAAVLADERAVRDFLAADPTAVRRTSPPFDGDPLTYLGLSKYLRLDKQRSDSFLRTATALLDAGADPNAGFWKNGEHETVLYGIAGVAHHGPLARVLIERGADPNDPEVVYHTPENWDMDAMRAVVETGRLTADSLALMLMRKHDWHHFEGVKYLLEQGADPNFSNDRWQSPLQHAILRDNDLPIIELLVDHGADFGLKHPKVGTSALGLAARRGRGDILKLAEGRGRAIEVNGLDALLAACALGDEAGVLELTAANAGATEDLKNDGGQVLAEFAGNDNTRGVALLLSVGVPVNARFKEGDGYWGIAKESTALHVASWRACHETAKLLILRGADVNARDAKGNTPLIMAIKACVDSYWTEWRSPDTVAALLLAGASTEGAPEKCGYDEVDVLIARQRGR